MTINKIKNSLIMLITTLFFVTTAYSDQTWDSETGAVSNYYFLVPANLTVISTGTPSDFYASYLNEELEWVKITKNFGWGTPQMPFTFTWTPDYPITNSFLGVHTSPRNENNFSESPTDITDTTINVIFSTADFSNTFESYTFYENYSLSFNYIPNTLPSKLLLEVTYDELEWISVKEVFLDNSGQGKVDFFNDIVNVKPVRFRLTYDNEIGKTHNIALTNWIGYDTPKFTIINKTKLETFIYNDLDSFELLFNKSYLSNQRSFVISYLSAGLDTVLLDTIVPSVLSQTVDPLTVLNKLDYNGSFKILYYSAWGELLNTVTLTVEDKYFTMNQYKTTLPLGGELIFNWSNSEHFKKVRIYEASLDLGPDSLYVIAKDWDIKKDYKVIKNTNGTFIYKLVAQDNVNDLVIETSPITWTNMYVCPEDSLQTVIDSLTTKLKTIETVTDTVLIKIIMDETTSVINTNKDYVSKLEELIVIDNTIRKQLFYDIHQAYVGTITGTIQKLNVVNNLIDLDVSFYGSGIYFIHVLKPDASVVTYKFLVR